MVLHRVLDHVPPGRRQSDARLLLDVEPSPSETAGVALGREAVPRFRSQRVPPLRATGHGVPELAGQQRLVQSPVALVAVEDHLVAVELVDVGVGPVGVAVDLVVVERAERVAAGADQRGVRVQVAVLGPPRLQSELPVRDPRRRVGPHGHAGPGSALLIAPAILLTVRWMLKGP